MKKKIALSVALFTSIFLLGGVYLAITIENATTSLNNLIKLHQVEILREQLLIDAKKVQTDLALQYTRYARTLETVITNVANMEKQARRCLRCHHAPVIAKKLHDLQEQIDAYENALSRYLTIRANASRLEGEENRAFKVGHALINTLNDMTMLTKTRLEKRTQTTLIKIREMKILMFVLIALGPIVAICLAVIFAHEFRKPISVLLEATRRLQGGDLNFRVHGLTDEFGELATALNDMAKSLEYQIKKMRRTEQMTMLGEMAAGLVHEIKNPLAGIKGSMLFLREDGNCSEEDRNVLSRVIEEVERVELLLKSLLNFAKPPVPQPISVNMNEILAATLDFSHRYSKIGSNAPGRITIIKDFASLLPLTMADPQEMHHVFLNLIMNATEAMPAGGTLTVRTSVSESAREIQLEIADTGKGITEELRQKIFKPFFTTKAKGTGLGLAICKQLIEMHDGTISAEDNPEGGTIFRIVLPITSAEAMAPAEAEKE